jgi:CopG family nickel-responsive transcriptional regulator
MEDLTNVQHDYRECINATMHIPLSEKQCLEVIVVNGGADNIRELTEKIMRLRGVEHVKLTSTGIKEK